MTTRTIRAACLAIAAVLALATLAATPAHAATPSAASPGSASTDDVGMQPQASATGCVFELEYAGYIPVKKSQRRICTSTAVAASLPVPGPHVAFATCIPLMTATKVNPLTSSIACSVAAYG